MKGVYEHTFPWSPEAVESLRQWRAKGMSSGQIATQLAQTYRSAVSRSAVIGKLSRLGIEMPTDRKKITMALAQPKRLPKPRSTKERTAKDGISERRAADLIRAVNLQVAAEAVPIRQADDADAIATAPCCIMGLSHHSCRWPLNRTAAEGEMMFCGNDKAESGSYCPGHAKRAFTRTVSQEQRNAEKRVVERHRDEAYAAGRRDRVFGFGMTKRFA